MYSAKHRASLPLSISLSATLHDGMATLPSSPAASMPSTMAVGLMSGEPTICSWVIVSWTSPRA